MKKLLHSIVILILVAYDIYAQCYNGSPSVNNPSNYNTSLSIHLNYNNARRWEEINRGMPANCLGNMVEPSYGWNNMSDDEIALYIHNSERFARGFLPFYGIETHLDAISQAHSDWQLNNDVFSHGGNPASGTSSSYTICSNCSTPITGSSPFNRMNQSAPLNGQWESEAENLASSATSGTSIVDFVASSIYRFLYQDSGSAWGHRFNVLANYNNNWGDSSSEGFIGVGVSGGFNFQACAYSCTNWNYAKILTIDYYDPEGGASGFNFSALPIELLAFNGQLIKNEVILTWNTTNEINNEYFLIEKSSDGIDFFEIGKIAASNNRYEKTNYSFVDSHLISGLQYYRLKQYDFDNSLMVSNILAIKSNSSEKINIYPNPVIDYLHIEFNLENTEILLSDVNGKMIYSTNNYNKIPIEPIDVSELKEGVYILQIRSASDIFSEKVIKVRK